MSSWLRARSQISCLPRLGICYGLPEGRESPVLSHQVGKRPEGKPHAPPEVLCVFPQGVDAKATQDHVII